MLGAVEFVMTDVVGELTLLGDVEFVTRGEFRDRGVFKKKKKKIIGREIKFAMQLVVDEN